MSLEAINNYVSDILTGNRSQDPRNIGTYFNLMSEAATKMLGQLKAARELTGLDKVVSDFLNKEEKKVIRESVNYILEHSNDLGRDLRMLDASGLLSLDENISISEYHLRYCLEPIFVRASHLYYDNLGWWQSFLQRNKEPEFFIEKFIEASDYKPGMESTMTDGLGTAR